jgi:hypothetical protein
MPSAADNKSAPPGHVSRWNELDKDQQTRLLIEYGHYLDTLPPTCSLQTKNERFAQWLAQKQIFYIVD